MIIALNQFKLRHLKYLRLVRQRSAGAGKIAPHRCRSNLFFWMHASIAGRNITSSAVVPVFDSKDDKGVLSLLLFFSFLMMLPSVFAFSHSIWQLSCVAVSSSSFAYPPSFTPLLEDKERRKRCTKKQKENVCCDDLFFFG